MILHVQDFLIKLEPLLWIAVGIALFRSKSFRRLPAVSTYFVVRGGSLVLLDWVILAKGMPECGTTLYEIYYYSYWFFFVASAVAVFFAIQEIFHTVMEPAPGLRRLGIMAFRWVSIVSAIVAVGVVALPAANVAATGGAMTQLIGHAGLEMARCLDMLELCLLAFLALSIHALGRSFRSRLFGVGLGFGIQAVGELITAAFLVGNTGTGLQSSANLFLQSVTTIVLLTWTTYFLLPEPEAERQMIVLPPTSMLGRWNALANGLGQMPQLATSALTTTGFFLQDIEGVVERVLAKNPVINSD
jgi:hypothetical protein